MGTSLYEQYQREQGGGSLYDQYKASRANHSKFTSAQLVGRANRAVENAQDEQNTPDEATQIAGGVASFGRSIPGAEILQAGARAGLRGQSYREAYNDIRGAETDAPAVVRNLNSATGGVISALATSGRSAVRQGAIYGAAEGALDANPDETVGQRARGTLAGAALGAAGGKAGDLIGKGVRIARALPVDENALARKAARKMGDKIGYGKAAAEATAAGGTSPAIKTALTQPEAVPFVDRVRASKNYAGADDATVLQKVYKRMGKQERGLNRRITEQGYDDALATQAEDLGSAKQDLLTAADPTMPSLRPAIQAHAQARGESESLRRGAKVSPHVLNKTPGPMRTAETLETQSPAAFEADIGSMKPGEAQAASEGLLGAAKGHVMHGSANPFTLFGAGPAVGRASRLARLTDLLDAQAVDQPLLRALRERGLPAGRQSTAFARALGTTLATP